jgi:hypothetical protein
MKPRASAMTHSRLLTSLRNYEEFRDIFAMEANDRLAGCRRRPCAACRTAPGESQTVPQRHATAERYASVFGCKQHPSQAARRSGFTLGGFL